MLPYLQRTPSKDLLVFRSILQFSLTMSDFRAIKSVSFFSTGQSVALVVPWIFSSNNWMIAYFHSFKHVSRR
jgi:hypothetical protein